MTTWSVDTSTRPGSPTRAATLTDAWRSAFAAADELIRAGTTDLISITVADTTAIILPERTHSGPDRDIPATLFAVAELRSQTLAALT